MGDLLGLLMEKESGKNVPHFSEKANEICRVENRGGKIVYIDSQTGDMSCTGYLAAVGKGHTPICRIDNLEFSDYIKGGAAKIGGFDDHV